MNKADMEGRYIELSMDQVPVTFSDEATNPCTIRMIGVPYKTTSQVTCSGFMFPAFLHFFKPPPEGLS